MNPPLLDRTNPPESLGLIGVGLLGASIAKRLLHGSRPLVAWDVNPACRDAAEKAGVQVAGSCGELLARCDVVFLSLPSDQVVAAVLREQRVNLRRGQTVIDTSTGDPDAVVRFAADLASQGVNYLDATVSGSSVQLAAGEAVLLVGATDDAFRTCEPLLRLLAEKVFHTGPPGSGATLKLVTNLVLGLNRAALAEGLAFAQSLGLELPQTLHLLRESLSYSRIMDTKGEKMIRGDFAPQARLSQHLKDVRLMLAAAERSGAHLPLSETHRTQLERAEALGCGDLDNMRTHHGLARRFRQEIDLMSTLTGGKRLLVLAAAAAALLFDGVELGLMPVASLSVSKSLLGESFTPTAGGEWFAWFTAALMFGAAVGGMLLGRLGDAIGRSRAMGVSVLFYSLFAGLGAWAQTQEQMLWLRFAVGLGVGGVWPNAVGARGGVLAGQVTADDRRPDGSGPQRRHLAALAGGPDASDHPRLVAVAVSASGRAGGAGNHCDRRVAGVAGVVSGAGH